MNTPKAILGATIVGGGKKKTDRKTRKVSKRHRSIAGTFDPKNENHWSCNVTNMPCKKSGCNANLAQVKCDRINNRTQPSVLPAAGLPAVLPAAATTPPATGLSTVQPRVLPVTLSNQVTLSDQEKSQLGKRQRTTGGMRVSVYKKYLDNLNVERLHKMAKSKGIKITKKKNGKTVYVKKATIIKKLCESKHGKR